jgi:hypothetical protein
MTEFIGEAGEILMDLLSRYDRIDGRKILECLREFGIKKDERTFERACLLGVLEYFERKGGDMTDEEFLAVLVRLVMMYFVKEKHTKSLWYLLFASLWPEEVQRAGISEVVRLLEEQFVEHMEVIEHEMGQDSIRNVVLMFLFKENADLIDELMKEMKESNGALGYVERILH